MKKRLVNFIYGWLPEESRKPQSSTNQTALPRLHLSPAVKLRLAVRIVIVAVVFPSLAIVFFSGFSMTAKTVSALCIGFAVIMLVGVVDAVAKRRYSEKTPAEVERF
jgi:hypothetical protein